MSAIYSRPTTGRLTCTVRGCATLLARTGTTLVCERGHTFDVARAGYVNLLQPQDRKSLAAGDSAEAVQARLRLAARGADVELRRAVGGWLERVDVAQAVLEVGAGPGVLLGTLDAPERYGLDLSVHAVERAAREHADATWIVANADRRLPFVDASLDVVLSMRGPKNPAEFARVLAPGGHLLLGVPGELDLAELRRATAGEALPRDPAARAIEAFDAEFVLDASVLTDGRREVTERVELDREGLADLLRTVYRGARGPERARAAELDALAVTQATVLLHLRPKPRA